MKYKIPPLVGVLIPKLCGAPSYSNIQYNVVYWKMTGYMYNGQRGWQWWGCILFLPQALKWVNTATIIC